MTQFDAGKIALLGAPSSAGARDLGQEQTPALLRELGLAERLRGAGLEVVDLGDLPVVRSAPEAGARNCRNLAGVAAVAVDIADAVEHAARERARLLVIGGDCTISIGVVAGLARQLESLGMMYLDGDLDLNTPETTASGILDGMGLAHMLGYGAEALSRIGPRYPLLSARDVAVFGYSVAAGGIDAAELDRMVGCELTPYPREQIMEDAGGIAAKALKALENRVDSILVHFDIDVVDFGDFPATKLPHAPGLSLAQTQQALALFMCSPKAVGLVVSEFNAECEGNPELARQLVDLLVAALA